MCWFILSRGGWKQNFYEEKQGVIFKSVIKAEQPPSAPQQLVRQKSSLPGVRRATFTPGHRVGKASPGPKPLRGVVEAEAAGRSFPNSISGQPCQLTMPGGAPSPERARWGHSGTGFPREVLTYASAGSSGGPEASSGQGPQCPCGPFGTPRD